MCVCSSNMNVFRCTSMSNNLNGHDSIPQSQEHAEYCIHQFALVKLWDQYGIVGDLTVSNLAVPTPLICRCLNAFMTAIYEQLSLCRYIQNVDARSPSPDHKRCIQGPPCNLGWRVPQDYIWWSRSQLNPQWYWLEVSKGPYAFTLQT